VLQEREIERVGESRRRKINIRIVTATHRDLLARVREGTFREDLYYRLRVFPIRLPPLRQRREDIPLLVSHFLQLFNGKTGKKIVDVASQAMQRLLDHPWPGNVRELENAMEHAFVLCRGDRIEVRDLPVELRHPFRRTDKAATVAAAMSGYGRPLTREALLALLTDCRWNKAEAGRRLGLSRTAVWKYMKKWSIPLQPEQ